MSRTTVGVRRPAGLLAAAAAALLVGVAGCGSSDDSSTAAPTPSASASGAASSAAGVLGIRDPWVKAADKGMTAAFGTLVNDTDTEVTITAASTDVSPMELHEMTMKDGRWSCSPSRAASSSRRTRVRRCSPAVST